MGNVKKDVRQGKVLEYEMMIAKQDRDSQEFLNSLTLDERKLAGVHARRISSLDTFDVAGHTYTFLTSLTWSRLKMLEQFRLKFGIGNSYEELYVKITKIWESLDAGKVATAAVEANNIRVALADNLGDKVVPMFDVFCCLICRDDENAARFDQIIHDEKVNDLKSSDLDIKDVFQLASKLVTVSLPI